MINNKINTPVNQSVLKIRELNLAQSNDWNSLVQAAPAGCFMQAWAWADFKELEGYKTFRYGLFLNEELVGGCIFYLYQHYNQANLLSITGGPILPANYPKEGMQLLLDKANLIAREMGAIALRIEPLWTEKPNYLAGFVRAPVDLLPCETLLIDLRPTQSKILASMKPKGRYNLRLSQRYGVQTEFTSDPQAIGLFYDLFWKIVQHKQFFGEPYGFFINLCQTLFAANMAEIGLASWRGELLAAILVIYWGDRATYLYGGRSLKHLQVMATYNLHWAAMQRAKTLGCTLYDFYGFTRQPNHAYAKFSQFKSQFGGVATSTIGAHDCFFYDSLADTLINLFKKLGGDRK